LVWESIRRHLLDPELLLRAKGEIEGSRIGISFLRLANHTLPMSPAE
jgi:hypothetical protein